ncbi:MAG TPA: hypothetical protein PLE99_09885 [Candidatus Thiothrix moscowensis]|uniref:hypothetical protein n=1 Tax=Thiothrix sp. UBA2016 TaxID=1947695 RepID=UPI0025D72EB0|nr:hypothetical protein [Thiothrix sp. UBA2016]HRJ53068.1 hypothetical protein [Candidatus Thiothrix moscowensis]HRJ93059.1 hypothetical protein [Candidatus Thiothrix moscowensis]
MDIKRFFTDHDSSITGTSTLDPLGLRVIWQGLGQQIFHNMVSSIANDVRNYTLSLFLHSVVKEVSNRCDFHSQKQKEYWGTPNSLEFKQRLFILLENLYIRSFVSHKEDNQLEVSTTGVLGIRKGVELSATPAKIGKTMRLAKQKSEILTNQLSLGVLGRYKTPLVNMGFLDGSLSYYDQGKWSGFEAMLGENPKLRTLQDALVMLVEQLLRTGDAEPEYDWSDPGTANLLVLFGESFKNPETVGSYAADFWLELTKLNQGVAGFVYANLDKESPQQAYLAAYQQIKLDAGQSLESISQLAVILDTEPFLAEMDLLFRSLCAQGIASLRCVIDHMQALGRSPQTFAECANKIQMNAVPVGSGKDRLEMLKRVVIDKAAWDTLIRALHSYHVNIMEDRGLSPWLHIAQDNRLHRHVGLYDLPTPMQPPGHYWWHSYYYYDLKNMARGLQGGQ